MRSVLKAESKIDEKVGKRWIVSLIPFTSPIAQICSPARRYLST